jgi:hypothetical protein
MRYRWPLVFLAAFLALQGLCLAFPIDWVPSTMPDCQDTAGQHVNYTKATNTFSCGTSGTGGGGGVSAAGLCAQASLPVSLNRPSRDRDHA